MAKVVGWLRELLSFIIYIPLQVLFIPLAMIGAILVAYKQMVVSKRLGLSQTAIEVINGRWAMHIFRMRRDHATAKLAAALPNTSLPGLWLVLFPLWLKANIAARLFLYPRHASPGEETLRDLITARTEYFDRMIERRLPNTAQFVILGAGYDTRAYGPFHRKGITFYELDQPEVQAHKLACASRARINTSHVRYVPVDFESEDFIAKLDAAGYDPQLKTIFLWEGVTLYLSEAAVRESMAKVRAISAPGSVLLVDLYARRMLKIGKSKPVSKMLDYTNEGLGFALELEQAYEATLRTFVEATGFTLGECYFMGSANERGPFTVVAEMVA